MSTSYDFESCWKYISGNYDADILDTKEHFMNQLKYMMEAAYEKGYDAGHKDGYKKGYENGRLDENGTHT